MDKYLLEWALRRFNATRWKLGRQMRGAHATLGPVRLVKADFAPATVAERIARLKLIEDDVDSNDATRID